MYSEQDKKIMQTAHCAKNKSRLRELIDFAHLSGYKNLGIASCVSMQKYAESLKKTLEMEGFAVAMINCRESGLDGATICSDMCGSCCDPLSQAKFLNTAQTDFNIVLGLCVGHEIIFQKYSNAPCSIFLVKDFLTGHKTVENL